MSSLVVSFLATLIINVWSRSTIRGKQFLTIFFLVLGYDLFFSSQFFSPFFRLTHIIFVGWCIRTIFAGSGTEMDEALEQRRDLSAMLCIFLGVVSVVTAFFEFGA